MANYPRPQRNYFIGFHSFGPAASPAFQVAWVPRSEQNEDPGWYWAPTSETRATDMGWRGPFPSSRAAFQDAKGFWQFATGETKDNAA